MQPKWWFITLVLGTISLVSIIASGCGIEQKQQRAGLQITTVEATAAAYLNGTYLNKTPLIEKNINPGTYTVRLVADDTSLAPFEEQVTLHPGTLSTVTWKPASRTELSSSVIYELESLTRSLPFWRQLFTSKAEQTTGDLKIVTIPDNAIINLASKSERQFAPFIFTTLPAGQVDYSVFLPSFETHQHTLDIKAGYLTTAIIKLAKNPPQSGESGLSQAQMDEQISAAATTSGTNDATQAAEASLSAKPGEPAVLIKTTGYLENGIEVLRVRSEPSQSSTTTGMAKVGLRLPYENETTDGWYKVLYAGKVGWVSQSYAALENASPSASEKPIE